MKPWRAPNNARAMREVEADLGPVIGSIERRPVVRRPTLRFGQRQHANSGVYLFASVGAAVLVGMVAIAVAWLAMTVAATKARGAEKTFEQRVIHDCSPDARKHCWRVIPKGREAIIACMRANKDKLGVRCRAYIYD